LQKDINGVIAGCVRAEKMMLDPEYAVSDREIVSRSAARPDFHQTRKVLQQGVAGYQKKIVPHKISAKRRQINHRNGYDDCRNERRLLPESEFRGRDSRMPFRS